MVSGRAPSGKPGRLALPGSPSGGHRRGRIPGYRGRGTGQPASRRPQGPPRPPGPALRWAPLVSQSPGLRGDPRDLALWRAHPIDPAIPSGHGFVLHDIDGDGFLDLVINNADWDTPDEEEAVLLYRNPGPSGFERPWPKFVLYQSPEFYGKEQVAVGDLDGDGRPDIAAQSENFVHLFYNRTEPGGALQFEHVLVEKPLPYAGAPVPSRWRTSTATEGSISWAPPSTAMASSPRTWPPCGGWNKRGRAGSPT